MNRIVVFVLSLVASVCIVSCASQEERAAQKAETMKKVTAALNTRKYTIDVRRMTTSKGYSKSVSGYWLIVRNDSLISALPYLGRAFSAPYGGGVGLNFSAPISSYNETTKKNGLREINIKVKNDEDSYSYRLQIFDNGSSSIDVQPIQRDPISFTGDMTFEKE